MMGQAVEKRGGHLGIAKYRWPFAKGEVGGDDDGCAFVKFADEVEQELAAGLGEGEVAKLVQDDEVEAVQIICRAALFATAGLGLKAVDQIDDIVEPPAGAIADQRAGNGDCQMLFTGSGAADQHDIALIGDEGAGGEIADQAFVDGRVGEGEVVEILRQWQLCDGELVADRPGRSGRPRTGGGSPLTSAISECRRSPTMRGGSCWRLMPEAMTSS